MFERMGCFNNGSAIGTTLCLATSAALFSAQTSKPSSRIYRPNRRP